MLQNKLKCTKIKSRLCRLFLENLKHQIFELHEIQLFLAFEDTFAVKAVDGVVEVFLSENAIKVGVKFVEHSFQHYFQKRFIERRCSHHILEVVDFLRVILVCHLENVRDILSRC